MKVHKEHEHTFKQKRKSWQEVHSRAIDQRKQQTSNEVGNGFAARQEREGFAEFVFADEFTNERFGAGNDERAWTPNDNGQIDEPAVLTVGHHCQTKDLENNSDDGETEITQVTETNETRKKNG